MNNAIYTPSARCTSAFIAERLSVQNARGSSASKRAMTQTKAEKAGLAREERF